MNPSTRLRVTFLQDLDSLGWIEMNVSWPLRQRDASTPQAAPRTSCALISYAYCPFGQLVAWMDAVARGKDPAYVTWENEGSDVHLGYRSGKLWFKNRDHKGIWIARIPADEVAATFYTAFREFVRSGYDRTQYETLRSLREVFMHKVRYPRTLTDLLRPITALSRQAAERAIQEIGESCDPAWEQGYRQGADPSLPDWWESAGRNKRLRVLQRMMNRCTYVGGSDTKIAGMRSKVIERHALPRLQRGPA